jgi:hypothetical protein
MIRSVEGVPDWFTHLMHRWRVRRCRRDGHTGTPVPGGVCTRCGYIWYTDDN